MANEMGNTHLELERNEPEEIESSYRVVKYKASELPEEFYNLIIATFLNSLRYGNDLFKMIDKEAYFPKYGQYINLLLKRPQAIIKLAMLRDKTVLGWSMCELKTVHYVWVKKEVRRQGIGKSLVPIDFDRITHITNKGISIWGSKYPNVRFDPFA